MPISTFTTRPSFEENPKLTKAALNLRTLLEAIEKKSIQESIEMKINEIIAGVNNFPGPDPELLKQIKSAQSVILKLLQNELGLVAKNHYQLQWLALGMAVFGIPMGVAFGMSLGNLAFLGIGLPIGMAIGIAVGNSKDKQAEEQGKQLDWVAK